MHHLFRITPRREKPKLSGRGLPKTKRRVRRKLRSSVACISSASVLSPRNRGEHFNGEYQGNEPGSLRLVAIRRERRHGRAANQDSGGQRPASCKLLAGHGSSEADQRFPERFRQRV